jgi:hypothetical protein
VHRADEKVRASFDAENAQSAGQLACRSLAVRDARRSVRGTNFIDEVLSQSSGEKLGLA